MQFNIQYLLFSTAVCWYVIRSQTLTWSFRRKKKSDEIVWVHWRRKGCGRGVCFGGGYSALFDMIRFLWVIFIVENIYDNNGVKGSKKKMINKKITFWIFNYIHEGQSLTNLLSGPHPTLFVERNVLFIEITSDAESFFVYFLYQLLFFQTHSKSSRYFETPTYVWLWFGPPVFFLRVGVRRASMNR